MDSMQCCSGLSDLSEFIRKYGTPSFLSGAVELLHWSGLTLVYLHVSANQPRVGRNELEVLTVIHHFHESIAQARAI